MKTQKHLYIGAALVALLWAGSAQAATFVVTKAADTADGVCNADCSLREAIIDANAAAGADIITLPAGTYTLTIAGTCENAAGTGDLDIINGAVGSDITINGAGAATTIIDGGDIDRVFHLPAITVAPALTLNNLTVRNGTAGGCTAFDAHGGGIRIDMGTVTLTNVVLSDNVAPDGNGGGILNSGTLTITQSTIGPNNSASVNGGGINNIGALRMVNSTVSGNTSEADGGGIASNTDTGGLRNVTITGNSAAGDGGGVAMTTDSPSLRVRNTIIAGNTDTGSDAPDCAETVSGGSVTSEGFNLIGNDTGCLFITTTGDQVGTGGSPINPRLGPLADNGGPTFTHALLTTPVVSLAIDTANPAGCFSDDANTGGLLTTDQRGRVRPLDGGAAGPSPAQCDIGAFELGGCGDGFVDAGEACDDGNNVDGDGCSATCTVETGFSCHQTSVDLPSICQKGCGDGTVQSPEECDDGNNVDGDGCSATCTLETTTTTSCGDGVLKAGEQCDDGNLTSGDGCSSTCTVEIGSACTDTVGAISVCTAGCGDAKVAGSEVCDDGNNKDGDGCSSLCRPETGFVCTGSPSKCLAVIYFLGNGGCSLIR